MLRASRVYAQGGAQAIAVVWAITGGRVLRVRVWTAVNIYGEFISGKMKELAYQLLIGSCATLFWLAK